MNQQIDKYKALLDKAVRKIDDKDIRKKMDHELRSARDLRKRNADLLQELHETRLHYRRELLKRGRELGEVKSALGIILRELLAARENSYALRQALPADFSEPGTLASAIRTLCNVATSKVELERENAQLHYDIGCMRAEIEKLASELEALRAFQSRLESEKAPF